MTNSQLLALLRKNGACWDARAWVGTRDLATAWRECHRGDWLLWLCARQIGQEGWPTHQQVVLAACACAETTALKYVPAGEDRPRLAIEAARAWARGEATLADVRKAAYAAAYAAAAAAAADAAADAAYAAYAAYAAAADADAYAADAADAARSQSLARSADLVRSLLTIPGGRDESR